MASPVQTSKRFEPNAEWKEAIEKNDLEAVKKLFNSMDKQMQEVLLLFHSSFLSFSLFSHTPYT